MRLRTLQRRSLRYHWRTNLAVVLGVAAGSAALTGALVVGDSMRASLREMALRRLGRIDHFLHSTLFFREALAGRLEGLRGSRDERATTAPLILASGAASRPETRTRANRINILGVDERFFALRGGTTISFPASDKWSRRSAVLNAALADELGVSTGDEILLNIPTASDVSVETLLGRRDRTTATLRLTIQSVVQSTDIAAFSLRARQLQPKNVFVPLETLQRALDRNGRVNAIAVAAKKAESPPEGGTASLQEMLAANIELADLGLTLRTEPAHRYVALESEAILLDPAVEDAAMKAAEHVGLKAFGVLTYLANRIVKLPREDAPEQPGRGTDDSGKDTAVPYSTVSAIASGLPGAAGFDILAGTGSGENTATPRRGAPLLDRGAILLNEWAAAELRAEPGDLLQLEYFVTSDFGELETQEATFKVRGIVALSGAAADTGWTPPYKGITDTDNLADWDPPFPVDFNAIRAQDEEYWDRYRATPKAFVTLADGQRLWAREGQPFGRLTSIRVLPGDDAMSVEEGMKRFERALRARLDPAKMGLRFEPVRAQLSAASRGTTDFGLLFLGFSFFLIAAAAMLVALLFRLGAERRAPEVGLLLAVGFAPRRVSRALLGQGFVLAIVGSAVGLTGSVGYAWLMLAGLQSWWSDAVRATSLQVHVLPVTLVVGAVASFTVAMVSLGWSLRGLTRLSPRRLLSGAVDSGRPGRLSGRGKTMRLSAYVAGAGFVLAAAMVLLSLTTEAVPEPVAFFAAGAAMLAGTLALFLHWLTLGRGGDIRYAGHYAVLKLGVRNAQRHPGRSFLTAALMAAATFVLAALQTFRLSADVPAERRDSPTGGFTLYAESTVPLLFDPNTPAGRDALDIPRPAARLLEQATIYPLRLRPGDETSCLNLYQAADPRVVGAPQAFLERGGFTFAASLAQTPDQRRNPWTLLDQALTEGTVPVIGDENAVRWQLHRKLGDDLVVTDERGRSVRLRFVALLRQSVLQDELVISEKNFKRLFPSRSGYSFFLIEAGNASASEIENTLEAVLVRYGFDAAHVRTRMAEYLAVQNTYLSTFQTLGGFGLVLGSLGLGAVLLRNVWERRGELGLLRALGFSHTALGGIVLAENAALLVGGLGAGVLAALVAVLPHLIQSPQAVPWGTLCLTLLGVFLSGTLAGWIAVAATLRAPLLPALRAE